MPRGNNAHGNLNGLNISRALIAENFGDAELAVGIGNVGCASTGDRGGTVQYYADHPSTGSAARTNQMLRQRPQPAPLPARGQWRSKRIFHLRF